ncbi:radical SAM protein [bacterium]|nr:radical SAM protein [bacterium]
MVYNRVLLVSPPSSSYLGAARPPQNLGFLARALMDNGICYDVLDMRLGYSFRHLKKKIDKFKPDLIGVTLVSLEYIKSYDLISRIKEYVPDVPIVAGGPHVTVVKNKVLEECREIDYGAVNEGEDILVELCKGVVGVQNIAGLLHRVEDEVVYNGPRHYTDDLDVISWPTYEKFELKKYIKEVPINSSRGCPYQCVFCPNKIISKRFRKRSALNVVDEVEYWYNKGYRVFNFDDDNFTLDNQRVFDICDEIEKRNIVNAEFRCSNGIRADRITRELLERMKEVGFNYIAFGVDGGNNKMLRINKKGETIEQIEEAIKNACELDYDVKIFVITGMPQETIEDVEDSFRIVQKYPIKRVILNNPIPYPGTELYETVKANNWFIKQPEEYLNYVTENEDIPVFETPEMSREARQKLLKRCRRIEKQVTQRAVERMYAQYGILAKLGGYIFASRFMERMFFQNIAFRRIIEHIRYRRLLTKMEAMERAA